MRGEENDIRWVRAGLAERILTAESIRECARTIPNAEPAELARLERILADIEQSGPQDSIAG